jgi:predicted amidohydrolase YtcJ
VYQPSRFGIAATPKRATSMIDATITAMCVACSPAGIGIARAVAGPALARVPFVRAPDQAGCGGGSDVIVHGGPILTMSTPASVEALAIRHGRIVAAGTLDEVSTRCGRTTEHLDLEGRAALPGFVEPHVHVAFSALAQYAWLDVSPLVAPTKEQGLAVIEQRARIAPAGQWVAAFGYDPSRLPDHAELDADDLDRVAGDRPVLVVNQSGHIGYVNHAALAAAGIDDATPDPPAGTYVRDRAGRLTGVLFEGTALAPFAAHLPHPSPRELLTMARDTLTGWARKGCTTVYDAGVGIIAGEGDLSLIRALTAEPACPVRIAGALIPELADQLRARPGDDGLVGIKYWADGSTQGFTAAVREPYLDGSGSGMLNHDEHRLREEMQAWHEAGWQLVVHSNGDRATEQVLSVYDAILGAAPRRHRHRIEHFTVTSDDQLAHAARLGLAVSQTIGHVHYWGASFRDHVLGPERARRIDPLADDERHGLSFSLHSDSPVTPVDPLLYVRTAVTRLVRGSGEVLGPEQRVSLESALRAVTIEAARHALVDDRAGSLEPGKQADLVVLDRDPRMVAPEDLHELEVVETWVGGHRRRWQDSTAAA